MNWDKWFQEFQNANGLCAYETDDLRAAYEAGQSESADKIARLEAECAALNDLLLSATPALEFCADLFRRIKESTQAGYKP